MVAYGAFQEATRVLFTKEVNIIGKQIILKNKSYTT